MYWGSLDAEIELDAPDVIVWGPDGNANLGRSLAVADLTGEGSDGLVIGAPEAKSGGVRVGMVAVLRGALEAELVDTAVDDDANVLFFGEGASDGFGIDLAAQADWNGDGIPDLAVGARAASAAKGAVYGFLASTLEDGVYMASDADVVIGGTGAAARTGELVTSAGDVNGDGLDDILVGALDPNLGGTKRGAAYLLTDVRSGEVVSVATAEFNGTENNAKFGQSAAAIGDVDGEGIGVAVGVPKAVRAGRCSSLAARSRESTSKGMRAARSREMQLAMVSALRSSATSITTATACWTSWWVPMRCRKRRRASRDLLRGGL